MLTSRQNPLIKGIRKLHHSKYRHKENLYLLEGTNLVSVAVALSYPLKVVLATTSWQQKHPQLWSQLQSLAAKAETVSEEAMAWLATTVNPEGIVAVAPVSLATIPLTSNWDWFWSGFRILVIWGLLSAPVWPWGWIFSG